MHPRRIWLLSPPVALPTTSRPRKPWQSWDAWFVALQQRQVAAFMRLIDARAVALAQCLKHRLQAADVRCARRTESEEVLHGAKEGGDTLARTPDPGGADRL